MWSSVINDFIIPGVSAVWSWFDMILGSLSGVTDFFIAVFFIVCSYRFILSPLFRGAKAGSDRAKHTKNDSSSDRQSDNMEG